MSTCTHTNTLMSTYVYIPIDVPMPTCLCIFAPNYVYSEVDELII